MPSPATLPLRRVLVVVLVAVLGVCALATHRPPMATLSATHGVAVGLMDMDMDIGSMNAGSVALAKTATSVAAAADLNEAMDCGGTVGGTAHTCMAATLTVLALSALSALTALAHGLTSGVGQRHRAPTPGGPSVPESGPPPWTVLSLTQLSVNRV